MKQAKRNANGLIDITGMFDADTLFDFKAGNFQDGDIQTTLDELQRAAFVCGVEDMGGLRWDKQERVRIAWLVTDLKKVAKILTTATMEGDKVLLSAENVSDVIERLTELCLGETLIKNIDSIDELLFITTVEARYGDALDEPHQRFAKQCRFDCHILKCLMRGFNLKWEEQNKKAA